MTVTENMIARAGFRLPSLGRGRSPGPSVTFRDPKDQGVRPGRDEDEVAAKAENLTATGGVAGDIRRSSWNLV